MGISDLKSVDWPATVKLALARGFASALVLTSLGALIGAFSGPQGGVGAALRFLLLWTFAAAVGGVLYIWILQAIAATLGRAIGIVTLVTSLMQLIVVVLVAIGDPLVCLLNKQVPQLLNVTDFKLFNMVAVIFVHRDTEPALPRY